MIELSTEAEDVLQALGTTDMGPGEPLPRHVLWAQVLDGDAIARGVRELEQAGLITCPDEMSVSLTKLGHDRIRVRAPSA